MTHDTCLQRTVLELEAARQLIEAEFRDYPTPLSGCAAQYSHLIGPRGSIIDALRSREALQFVASPRTQSPGAGVESR